MIILDTNVVSEVMRSDPDQGVIRWLDAQPESSIWTTCITTYEIEFGLRRLPQGKRRELLDEQFRAIIGDEFEGRVLALDSEAALAAGVLGAELQAVGRNVDVRDVLIAGLARSHQATVATRNVRDFEGACDVVNPWDTA